MSGERMDHAAAAVDLMRRLALHPAPDGEHDVEWGFREAQVHATLALVAEQHTANLIAYVAKWTDDEILGVDAHIREALGLT